MRTPTPSPPLDLLVRVGSRIRRARSARGMTRASLAAASGVSMRFLAQLESGTANISLARLDAVAQALGCDLGSLFASKPRDPAAANGDEIDAAVADIASRLEARSAAELAEIRTWLDARFARTRGPLVALLGLRGAGKSTVGKQLARRLRVPFFELDALIERAAGLPLAQIFELQGEAYYRRLERRTLADFLATTPAAVLATGGGVVTDAETYALLRAHCTTVWLQATPDLHWRRVVRQGDRRPMRGHPGAMQELRALLAARGPLYAQAHLRIDTADRGVAAVASDLAAQLGPHTAEPRVARRRSTARKA